MNKIITKFFLGILFLAGVISCDSQNTVDAIPSATYISKEILPVDKVFENTKEMIAYTKQFITEVSSKEAKGIMEGHDKYYIIDIRTSKEYSTSYIPRGFLEFRIARDSFWSKEGLSMPAKESMIIIYCKGGIRSMFAAKTLAELGYTNVVSIKGGFIQWQKDFPKNV